MTGSEPTVCGKLSALLFALTLLTYGIFLAIGDAGVGPFKSFYTIRTTVNGDLYAHETGWYTYTALFWLLAVGWIVWAGYRWNSGVPKKSEIPVGSLLGSLSMLLFSSALAVHLAQVVNYAIISTILSGMGILIGATVVMCQRRLGLVRTHDMMKFWCFYWHDSLYDNIAHARAPESGEYEEDDDEIEVDVIELQKGSPKNGGSGIWDVWTPTVIGGSGADTRPPAADLLTWQKKIHYYMNGFPFDRRSILFPFVLGWEAFSFIIYITTWINGPLEAVWDPLQTPSAIPTPDVFPVTPDELPLQVLTASWVLFVTMATFVLIGALVTCTYGATLTVMIASLAIGLRFTNLYLIAALTSVIAFVVLLFQLLQANFIMHRRYFKFN